MTRTALIATFLLPAAACFSPEESVNGSGTETPTSGTTEAVPTSSDVDTTGDGSDDAAETERPETDTTQPTTSGGDDAESGEETGDVPVTCGNGEPDEGEACDDGNDVNGDGCNNNCVESGSVVWESTFEDSSLTATALAINDDDEIMVVAKSGDEEVYYADWRRLYAPDGTIVSTGSTNGLDVSRISASGNNWSVVHLDETLEEPGGHEFVGHFSVSRIDSLFDPEWSIVLPNRREIGAIHSTSGGDVIVSGGIHNSGAAYVYEHDGFIARYSNGGTLDWQRFDEDDGAPRDCHPSATLVSGGYAVACAANAAPQQENFTGQIFVRHYHSGGTLASEHHIENIPEVFWSWQEYFGNDRRYPTMASGPSGESALVLVDRVFAFLPNGNPHWDAVVQEAGDEFYFSAAYDGAGAIVLGGHQQSASGTAGLDGVLVKLSPDGDVMWTHVLAGPSDDEIRAVSVTQADRVVFAGTQGYETGTATLYVGMLEP